MDIRDRVHYVVVTGIIKKGDRYLICQRSPDEKAFGGKWCVPGGKVEMSDFVSNQKDTTDHWFDVLEKVLCREILEETGLEIKNISHVSNLAFIRGNGFSTIILSMKADYSSGRVSLNDELIDHAWVTLGEAKKYDLIENIYEQIEKVHKN